MNNTMVREIRGGGNYANKYGSMQAKERIFKFQEACMSV